MHDKILTTCIVNKSIFHFCYDQCPLLFLVYSICVSPGGGRGSFVSCGEDSTVRVWRGKCTVLARKYSGIYPLRTSEKEHMFNLDAACCPSCVHVHNNLWSKDIFLIGTLVVCQVQRINFKIRVVRTLHMKLRGFCNLIANLKNLSGFVVPKCYKWTYIVCVHYLVFP